MIKSFKHKGLRKFFVTGSTAGIGASHAEKLREQLFFLDTAESALDMDVGGNRLHQLSGRSKVRWSVRVSSNWCITFEFRNGNPYVLDYEDYH